MTIRKGEQWGESAAVDPARQMLADDAELHRWVNDHRRSGTAIPPVTLLGGDLVRTCGGGRSGVAPTTVTRVTLDIVRIEFAEQTVWMTSHLVARRSWWRGEVAMAMNAQFWRGFDVAPRSHPNDGRVDVLTVDSAMPRRARLQARGRAQTGTHVPHPQLQMRSVREIDLSFAKPLDIVIDTTSYGRALRMGLTVEPDAYEADVCP